MPPDAPKKQFLASAPFLVVKDLRASVEYFHQKLGFTHPELWGDPPCFAMPSRDGFIVMLEQAPAGTEPPRNSSGGRTGVWDTYIWVRNADTLFAEFGANGAIIEYEPCIREAYDMKEFAVRDLDGHIIAFGQDHKP